MTSNEYIINLIYFHQNVSKFDLDNDVTVIVSVPDETLLELKFAENIKTLSCLLYDDKFDIEDKLSFLGLYFSLVVLDTSNGKSFMATGASSYIKLYFKQNESGIEIRDCLPRIESLEDAENLLNIGQLETFLAGAWVSGPFELRHETECIRKDWRRVPCGHSVTLDPIACIFRVQSFDNIFTKVLPDEISYCEAVSNLRESVDSHITNLGKLGPVSSEFSGGIDSGIVLARSSKLLGKNFKGGLTSNYPFYEFSREQIFRDKILNHVNSFSSNMNHEEMLPFLRIPEVPIHDEPSVGSTSWGQFSAAVRSANRLNARVLLTGHGGDTMFLIPPSSKLNMSQSRISSSWVSKKLTTKLTEVSENSITYINGIVQPSFGGLWHPAMFEPGYLPRYASYEFPYIRYTSGLISRDSLRAAAVLWFKKPKLDKYMQKPFGHLVYGNDIPKEIWTRPGKVNHLANIYRGSKLANKSIMDLALKYSKIFELIDVSPKKFINFTMGVIEGRDSGNQMFTQFLSVLIWLNSHISSDLSVESKKSVLTYRISLNS